MNTVARLLSYGRRYWPHLLASVGLMAVAGAAQAAMLLLVRQVFDRVLVDIPPAGKTALLPNPIPIIGQIYLEDVVPIHGHNVWVLVAVAIVFVFLIKGLFDYCGNYLISYAGYSSVTDLRNAVFEKILRHGAAFYESNSIGQMMSSVMNDVDKVQVATSQIMADFLRQIFAAAASVFVLVSLDPKLTLASLIVLPAIMLPTTRVGRRIRRTSRRTQERQAELNQILQETLSGHMVVRAFAAESYEAGRFRAAARRLLKTNVRYVLQQGLSSPMIDMLAAATIVGLLTYAKQAHSLTAGGFSTFVIALILLLEPVKRLVGIYNIFQQAIGASHKVFEYLDHPVDIAQKPGAVKLARFSEAIRFENVSFHYPGAPAGFRMQGLDLEVKAGQVVALVGGSGGGKTTVANLVPRFYDVTAGAVKVDGYDVRDLDVASLRECIGMVAQDTFLFNDTVERNIAYGRPNVKPEEIRRAAETALAHEFIERLPEGYQTVIGDRGAKLSGGQRQRIAIARALLKNAPILILDEATSHLDTESEMLVQKALANLMEHRTVIVIAHRLSTIRRADKIVVLQKGRIKEQGTHDELIELGGIYHRLHDLQFEDAGSVVDL
ncbi:MAG: ABC transporter ATP-binding protein, partial [Ignavibacteriota bacterium]